MGQSVNILMSDVAAVNPLQDSPYFSLYTTHAKKQDRYLRFVFVWYCNMIFIFMGTEPLSPLSSFHTKIRATESLKLG